MSWGFPGRKSTVFGTFASKLFIVVRKTPAQMCEALRIFHTGFRVMILWLAAAIFELSSAATPAELPAEVQAAVAKLDYAQCMPLRPSDLSWYSILAVVRKPKFESYVLDHGCFENISGDEGCSSYWNVMAYSFSNVKVLLNHSRINNFSKLSVTYKYDAVDRHKWSGIYLQSNVDYLIGINRKDFRDTYPEIALACEIPD